MMNVLLCFSMPNLNILVTNLINDDILLEKSNYLLSNLMKNFRFGRVADKRMRRKRRYGLAL